MILRHFSPTTARRAASMLLLLGAVIALLAAPAHARPGAPRPATLAASFQKAATSFSVPTDLLMAIAYINTHWQPLAGTPTEDHGYGPMHLTVQPGGDTLARAARLLNVPPELLRQDDGANIMGGAALLHDLWITCEKTKPTSDLAPWFGIVARYSNFTDPRVANSYAQDVFDIMRRGVQAVGPNGETLSIQPHPGLVTQDTKPATQNADEPLSADYGPALWAPAYSGNYEAGRSGNRINYIIIHDTEGSYQSTINWFQNPQSGVSAHYVVRSRDGEITQMVRDADTAYHAGNYPYNLQAIGIEHEGYASQNTWYTEAMYNSSAELARTLADRYGVAKDHAHIIGHYQVPYPSTHTDPGQYWRWAYYMSKVRRDWARSALVDNSDPGFTANPPAPGLGWQIFNGIGYNGSSSYMALSTTGSATNSGTWQAALPRSSTYDLYAYIPWTNNGNSETQSARYTVTTVTGTVQVVINQKALTDAGILQNGTTQGEWAHLGRYTFGTAATVTLSNSASDSGRNVWFDALMWIPINSAYPPCGGEYEASQSSGAVIVPGTVDVGNHCDECTTTITLPFTVTLYDHPFVDAVLGSNGTIGFATNSNVFTNTCMPAAAFSYALLPYWDDLRTDGTGNGIFTSINGSAPNRIFNIEWRAGYFSGGGTAHFETRLYENQNRFDMVYDTLSQGSNTATTGIQRDTGSGNHFTQFLCNMGGLGPGMIISYTLPTCPGGGTPTPTNTPVRTATPLSTPTRTPTSPPSPTVDPSLTPTPTYTRTPSATPSPTPTASACPLQVAISATCLVAGGGLRDFMFDVEGYNPSSQPITATHFIYLEVSSDGITYGFIRRTSATDVIFQPGVTTPITGTFTGMDVPPPNMYYRIRAFVIAFQPCGQQNYYSPGYMLCGLNTPTPSSTPVATTTPTNTSSPTATSTRIYTYIPTITPTPRPGTPTATPSCTITFSDVYPTDYFYVAVRYLYCHGVISGYADGTFRPGSNTTRGQLTKIVTLAEGWSVECPSTGHFSDVPAGSVFYCFVETAFSHGVISGYADGTFRPTNNVTRAQLCKIIVLAQGWSIDTTGGPHFTDVAPTDTFYGFIETAFNHSVVSGYDDHTFRHGNPATRGQISKIVYQALGQP